MNKTCGIYPRLGILPSLADDNRDPLWRKLSGDEELNNQGHRPHEDLPRITPVVTDSLEESLRVAGNLRRASGSEI
jgi:hypothetical protein